MALFRKNTGTCSICGRPIGSRKEPAHSLRDGVLCTGCCRAAGLRSSLLLPGMSLSAARQKIAENDDNRDRYASFRPTRILAGRVYIDDEKRLWYDKDPATDAATPPPIYSFDDVAGCTIHADTSSTTIEKNEDEQKLYADAAGCSLSVITRILFAILSWFAIPFVLLIGLFAEAFRRERMHKSKAASLGKPGPFVPVIGETYDTVYYLAARVSLKDGATVYIPVLTRQIISESPELQPYSNQAVEIANTFRLLSHTGPGGPELYRPHDFPFTWAPVCELRQP